jgi:hypothetical protein
MIETLGITIDKRPKGRLRNGMCLFKLKNNMNKKEFVSKLRNANVSIKR